MPSSSTAEAVGLVFAEALAIANEIAPTLELLGELGRRCEVQAFTPSQNADLAICAASVRRALAQMARGLREERERLRLASGLRRRAA